MTTQERLVRPYAGVDAVQALLDPARLHVGNDVVQPGDRLTIPLADFVTRSYRIHLTARRSDAVGWTEALRDAVGVAVGDPSNAHLAVVASTSRLKLVEVVDRFELTDDALSTELTIADGERRAPPMRAPRSGVDISVVVLLARAVERRPLRAWRKGTWLGRVDFAVRSDADRYGFEPIVLDVATRDRLGLARGATRYVRVSDPTRLVDAAAGEELVELYVDETLLAQLSRDSTSAWSRAVQAQLFLDSIDAVVCAAVRHLPRPASYHDVAGSLLARVVDIAVGAADDRPRRRDDALRLMYDEPSLFMARIEARTDHLTDMLGAGRGGS